MSINLQAYKNLAQSTSKQKAKQFKTLDISQEGQQSGGGVGQTSTITSAACSQSFVLPRSNKQLNTSSSKQIEISGKKINYKNCSNLNICHDLSSISYKNNSQAFKKPKKSQDGKLKKRPGTAQSRVSNMSVNQSNSHRGNNGASSSLSKRGDKSNSTAAGSRYKPHQFSVRKYSAQPTQNIGQVNSDINSCRKTNKSLSPPKNNSVMGKSKVRNERSLSRAGIPPLAPSQNPGLSLAAPSKSPNLLKDSSKHNIEEIVRESLNKVKIKKAAEDRLNFKEQLKRIDKQERKKKLNEQIRTMNKHNQNIVQPQKKQNAIVRMNTQKQYMIVARSQSFLKDPEHEKLKGIDDQKKRKPNDHGMTYFKIKEELFKKKGNGFHNDSQQASMIQTRSPAKSFYKFDKKENLTPSPEKPKSSIRKKSNVKSYMKYQKKKIKIQKQKQLQTQIDQQQRMLSNLRQLDSYIKKSFKQIPQCPASHLKSNHSQSTLTGRKSSLGAKKIHGSRKSSQAINKSGILQPNPTLNNYFSQQPPEPSSDMKEFELFCIVNSAALLIQKSWKKYKLRMLDMSVKQNYDYITFNQQQKRKVEIPEVQMEKKKIQQHTFSFGNQLPVLSPPKDEPPSFQYDHPTQNMFEEQQRDRLFQNVEEVPLHIESPEIEEDPVRIPDSVSIQKFQQNMQQLEFRYRMNIKDLVKQQRILAESPTREPDPYLPYEAPQNETSQDPAQYFGNAVGSYHPNPISSVDDANEGQIESGGLDLGTPFDEDEENDLDGAGASALLESSMTEKIIYMSTINSGGGNHTGKEDGQSSNGALNAGPSQEARLAVISQGAQDESFVNEIYSQLNREIEDQDEEIKEARDREEDSTDGRLGGIAEFESDEESKQVTLVEELYQEQINTPDPQVDINYESNENSGFEQYHQQSQPESEREQIVDIITTPRNEQDSVIEEYGSNRPSLPQNSSTDHQIDPILLAQLQISKDDDSILEIQDDLIEPSTERNADEMLQGLKEQDLEMSDPYRLNNPANIDIIDQEIAPETGSLVEQVISELDQQEYDYESLGRMNSDGKEMDINQFIQASQEERKFSFSLSENLDDRRSVRSTHGALQQHDHGPFSSGNNGHFYSHNTDNPFSNTTISLFDKNPFKDFTKSMITGMLDPAQDQNQSEDKEEQDKMNERKQQLYKFRKKRNYEIEKWVSTPPDQNRRSSILSQNSAPGGSHSSRILGISEDEVQTVNSVKQLSELQVGVTERQQELLTMFTSPEQHHHHHLTPSTLKPTKQINDQIDTPTFADTNEELKLPILDTSSKKSDQPSESQDVVVVTAAAANLIEVKKSDSIPSSPPPLVPIKPLKEEQEDKAIGDQSDQITSLILSALLDDAFRNHNTCKQKAIYYKRLQRGIKADPSYISDYMDIVFSSINEPQQFLQKFTTPIYRDPQEILELLQNMEIGSQVFIDMKVANKEVDNPNSIVPVDLYLDIENAVAMGEQEQSSSLISEGGLDSTLIEQNNVVTEAQHIHNKAIFDAINQALDELRPYGDRGDVMPWSNFNRSLKTVANTSKEEIAAQCKDKVSSTDINLDQVIGWSKSQAGALPNNEFFVNNYFDEEYFSEFREKKLAHILAQELIEEEKQWLDYELEEAQVKIDLGDMLLEELVGEVTGFLGQKLGRMDSDQTEQDSFQF